MISAFTQLTSIGEDVKKALKDISGVISWDQRLCQNWIHTALLARLGRLADVVMLIWDPSIQLFMTLHSDGGWTSAGKDRLPLHWPSPGLS